jgi:transposase
MPGGYPAGNPLERNGEALGCCPAVDDDGEDRVLPQRGLPPAGVAEQIRAEAAPHGGGGVDGVLAVAVLDAVPPIRGQRGRPRRRPRELFADRGYDHDKYRRLLRVRGITPRIARRGVAHGSGLGKQRWVVERGFAWLHAFKRLRTRYEHRADIHLGLLQLACALICYRQLPSF